MDAAMIPGAMPPKLKRKRRNPNALPPEEEMLPEEIPYEGGPTTFGMPAEGAMNVAYGAYGEPAPGTLPMVEEPANPLAGPMFRRYRQTANAGMPGQAEPATDNPMEEPFPNPFETPQPARSVTVPGGASVSGGNPSAASTPGSSYTQTDDPNKKSGSPYQGRYGRRQTARSMPSRRR